MPETIPDDAIRAVGRHSDTRQGQPGLTQFFLQSRYALGKTRVSKTGPRDRTDIGQGQISPFTRKRNLGTMETAYSLEIIATHFTIETIALQAFETPVGEILTWVVVLARIFTGWRG